MQAVQVRCRHRTPRPLCRHLATLCVAFAVTQSACGAPTTEPEVGFPTPAGIQPGAMRTEQPLPPRPGSTTTVNGSEEKATKSHSTRQPDRRGGRQSAPIDKDTIGTERQFTMVGTTSDDRGDQGLEGPAYADIVTVGIEDNGSVARITVRVAEELPTSPRAGELIGVGVDLWRDPSGAESDYQLFAEGRSDGWFAHLQTPSGFVNYPGEFWLAGRIIVFEVPWSHLGEMRSGGFRTFYDWSQRRTGLNAAAYDLVPATRPATFER